jgi:hypothetical protein
MKTKTEPAAPGPANARPQGQFKTMQALIAHKYRDLNRKLEAALKDHPAFQKPS